LLCCQPYIAKVSKSNDLALLSIKVIYIKVLGYCIYIQTMASKGFVNQKGPFMPKLDTIKNLRWYYLLQYHTYFYRCIPLIYKTIRQVYKGPAKSKMVWFVLRGVLYKKYPILNIYAVCLCKHDTSTNCTDNSISKMTIVLLLSSQSLLKMTNISPYGI